MAAKGSVAAAVEVVVTGRLLLLLSVVDILGLFFGTSQWIQLEKVLMTAINKFFVEIV